MHLAQLFPFGGSGLDILDTDTQLNPLQIKWIQWLVNPTNAIWKDLMLYVWTESNSEF